MASASLVLYACKKDDYHKSNPADVGEGEVYVQLVTSKEEIDDDKGKAFFNGNEIWWNASDKVAVYRYGLE